MEEYQFFSLCMQTTSCPYGKYSKLVINTHLPGMFDCPWTCGLGRAARTSWLAFFYLYLWSGQEESGLR